MNLKGKVLISTVSAHKSVEIRKIFEPLGAAVIDFPMTEIHTAALTPADRKVISDIGMFHWIIFTSVNGVSHFHKLMDRYENIQTLPHHIKIAAVGSKTAAEIENTGRRPDFTGSGNTAEELVCELIEKELLQNCNVLLPLGNLSPGTIAERLNTIAGVTRINVYNTIKTISRAEEPVTMIRDDRYNLVLFTSPSGVSNFMDVIGPENLKHEIRAASIGQVTSDAAKKLGLQCLVTASRSTYEGLAREIINYYTLKR